MAPTWGDGPSPSLQWQWLHLERQGHSTPLPVNASAQDDGHHNSLASPCKWFRRPRARGKPRSKAGSSIRYQAGHGQRPAAFPVTRLGGRPVVFLSRIPRAQILIRQDALPEFLTARELITLDLAVEDRGFGEVAEAWIETR